jgi:hypothetical protein
MPQGGMPQEMPQGGSAPQGMPQGGSAPGIPQEGSAPASSGGAGAAAETGEGQVCLPCGVADSADGADGADGAEHSQEDEAAARLREQMRGRLSAAERQRHEWRRERQSCVLYRSVFFIVV